MPDSPADDAGFLSRWSQRKALARQGVALPEAPPPAAPTVPASPPAQDDAAGAAPAAVSAPPPAEPPPTLEDVQALAPGADVRRFVAPGVDATVRNAALKKLFADPHFNLMDGLDTYIDDYGKPDPLPAAMLRRMVQSGALGLLDDDPPRVADTSRTPTPPPLPAANDEDADLRLQPDDAAGPASPEPGARPDPGREH